MPAMNSRRSDLGVICLMILTTSIITLAQTTTTGAIQGNVFDADSKASVPGATVTVKNEETDLVRTTLTNKEGVYFIGMLPPGVYALSATLDSYAMVPSPDDRK